VTRAVLIVGESPNVRGKAAYETKAGKRLRTLLGNVEYPWVNLFEERPERWSAARAREEASSVLLVDSEMAPTLFVLLGRRVATAFGKGDKEFLSLDRAFTDWWYIFPHPSGRSRWWNDPRNELAAVTVTMHVFSEWFKQ